MENKRLWEIDSLRGIAVCAMVLSNFLFDLFFFVGLSLSPEGWPGILARLTAGTFIFLVGVSLTLSYARRKTRPHAYWWYLRRGIGIVLLGIVVTVATWFAAGTQLVLFGVLHLIGVSIVISYPFFNWRMANIILGLAVFAGGIFLKRVAVHTLWLLPFGLSPANFISVDYAPLFPWWGLVLIGIGIGNLLYPGGKRRYALPDLSANKLISMLSFAGRHSLIVYFAHQPLLLGGLWVYMKLR
ncbi:MAG: heparan-alpha-glucosaminide N-acetyltransferase [Deltaproteobacteria bacterium]